MTDIEAIKAKIDLVDYIGKYVMLKKAGTNYKGLCPFHLEKTGSFMVSPDKQIWHCFGCARGGDVIKFLMEKEGMSFVEALQSLAEQAGVSLSKVPQEGINTRKRLLNLNEAAAKFYEKMLEGTDEGRKARDYLIDRGLTPETISEFRAGYAPSNGKALMDFLIKRGASEADILQAGLGARKGTYLYDKFVNRVMFPIADSQGRVVAFTGRVLDSTAIPKYLNSPETIIFKKGEVLYGLHLAKQAIQQSNQVVLVEGQMDCISSHQADVRNVVATSGTAITEMQLNALRRYATEIVMALDADMAGGEATKRVFELASNMDLSIKVALLDEAKDPDTLIKQGAERWLKAIEEAVSIPDFYFSQAIKKYDLQDLEGRKQFTREILPVVGKLSDPVEKDHYIKKLGRLVSVEPNILYDSVRKVKVREPFSKKPAEKEVDKLSPLWLEERLIVLPLVFTPLLPQFMEKAEGIKWASGLANGIYENLRACYTSPDSFELEKLTSSLSDSIRTQVLELMLVVEQSYVDVDVEELKREMLFYMDILRKRSFALKRNELVEAIESAEKQGDQAKLAELLKELNQLS